MTGSYMHIMHLTTHWTLCTINYSLHTITQSTPSLRNGVLVPSAAIWLLGKFCRQAVFTYKIGKCAHVRTHTHTHTVLKKFGMSDVGLALLNIGTITHSAPTVSSAVHTVSCMFCMCVWAHVQAHAWDKTVNKERKNKGDYITDQNYQEIPLDWRDQYKYSTTLITSVRRYENEIMSTKHRRTTKN